MIQGIVIQGPTNYFTDIIPSYANIPNVVFSTWSDEPKENIEQIKSYGITVLQSDKPKFSGNLNVNLQSYSSLVGIRYLKEKKVDEILKVRGDLKINNVSLLLKILESRQISFLSICKQNVRPLNYYLGYQHSWFDFPCDFMIYGKTIEIEKCFNFQINNHAEIPPESLIAYSYCVQSKIKFELNYSHFIKNNMSFFARDCIKNNITVYWLKHNREYIPEISDSVFYEC